MKITFKLNLDFIYCAKTFTFMEKFGYHWLQIAYDFILYNFQLVSYSVFNLWYYFDGYWVSDGYIWINRKRKTSNNTPWWTKKKKGFSYEWNFYWTISYSDLLSFELDELMFFLNVGQNFSANMSIKENFF